MNHTLSDSQLEAMVKSAVNSFGPLPPDEKFSQLISALRELQERRKADSEPVIVVGDDGGDALSYRRLIQSFAPGTKLYLHAQPPVVPDIDELRLAFEAAERESGDGFNLHKYGIGYADDETQGRWDTWLACRAAMLNGGK